MSPREIVAGVLFIDEPVVSHDKPGAADHSSVDWDVLLDPTQSNSGLSPDYFIHLVLVFNFIKSIYCGSIKC